MAWFEHFSYWCALQQPFGAAIHLFLCFALTVSLAFLAFGSLLKFADKKRLMLFFSLYLVAKGFSCIGFFIPLSSFWGAAGATMFQEGCLLLELYFLGLATFLIAANAFPRLKAVPAWGLYLFWTCVLVCLSFFSWVLPAVNLAIGVALFWVLFNIKGRFPQRLGEKISFITKVALAYFFLDFFAWGPLMERGLEIYQFLAWADGAIAICVLAVTCSELLVYSEDHSITKKGYSRHLLLAEWLCLIGLIVFFAWGSRLLVNGLYKESVNDIKKDAQILNDRIYASGAQTQTMLKSLSGSPSLLQLVAKDGEHNKPKAVELISRYAGASKDSVCYVFDSAGVILASSEEGSLNVDFLNKIDFASYFKQISEGGPSLKYIAIKSESKAYALASAPIYDPITHEVIGIVIMKRLITTEMVFASYAHAFLFDNKGQTLIAVDLEYLNVDREFFFNQKTDPVALFESDRTSYSVLKLKDGYYIFALDQLDEADHAVGILYPAHAIFKYRAVVYVAAIWVLIFVSSIFVFARYFLVRADLEIKQSKEMKEILDCSPNCIAILDRQLICRRINGAEVPFLGLLPQDLEGKAFMDLWPMSRRDFMKDRLERVFQGEQVSFESEYIHPDGHAKYFFIFCGPLFSSDNQVSQIVTIWVDITHRKRIEQDQARRLELEHVLSLITERFFVASTAEDALQESLVHVLRFTKADRVSWFQISASDPDLAYCLYKHEREGIDQEVFVSFFPKTMFYGAMLALREQLSKGEICYLGCKDKSRASIEYLSSQKLAEAFILPILLDNSLCGFVRLDFSQAGISIEPKEAAFFKTIVNSLQEGLARFKTQQNIKLLDVAVKCVDDGIVIVDLKHPDSGPRIVFANQAVCKITGYSLEELLGASPSVLDHPINGDRRMQKIYNKLIAKENYHEELSGIRKDGTEYLVDVNSYPILNSRGDVTHSVSVRRDVTAEKKSAEKVARSEQLLRTIFDILPQRILWKDKEGHYLGANNRFLGDCGTTDIIGKTDYDMPWSQEQADAYRSDDLLVINSQKSKLDIIEKQTNANGDIWLSTSKVPMWDAAGNVNGVLCTYMDITPLKKAEQERQLIEIQLRQAQKLESIGHLAAGIAHEINTPAQFISDNLYFIRENWAKISPEITMLQNTVGDDQSKHRLAFAMGEMPGAISDALEGVGRISTIVQAMRDYAHSSGERTRADINKAIRSTVTVARNEWKYVADIKLELAEDLPQVLCYMGDINEVILNIVVNASHAIKERYKDSQKGVITIRSLGAADHVVLEFEDDGNGIPQHIIDKIFDPFFTTKPQGQGTGQGLYISRRIIVDRHHGEINVNSTPGVGTKFTIKLPLS